MKTSLSDRDIEPCCQISCRRSAQLFFGNTNRRETYNNKDQVLGDIHSDIVECTALFFMMIFNLGENQI